MLSALLLLGAFALASPPNSDPTVPVNAAERQRQMAELHLAASRNAWSGVERAYQALQATRTPLTAEVHLTAAQAAQHRGDAAATRERLMAALSADPTRQEARDSIMSINAEYGSVSLMGDRDRVALTAEVTPMNPAQRQAITFAQRTVERTGTFVGLLPAGHYRFGPHELEVRPSITTQTLDARSDRTLRRLERDERRGIRP